MAENLGVWPDGKGPADRLLHARPARHIDKVLTTCAKFGMGQSLRGGQRKQEVYVRACKGRRGGWGRKERFFFTKWMPMVVA